LLAPFADLQEASYRRTRRRSFTPPWPTPARPDAVARMREAIDVTGHIPRICGRMTRLLKPFVIDY
jgi:hypothetical protein